MFKIGMYIFIGGTLGMLATMAWLLFFAGSDYDPRLIYLILVFLPVIIVGFFIALANSEDQ